MRLAGSIRFDIAEITGVMIYRHRPTVMFLGWIKMGAGRRRICRRTIALLVNMEAVLARFQILNVGDHLDFIANFCECDRAGNLAARFGLELRRRFRDLLRLPERDDGAENCPRQNCFHVASVPLFSAK